MPSIRSATDVVIGFPRRTAAHERILGGSVGPVSPHSYTIALRSQWVALVDVLRSQPGASATAVQTGLDREMVRVLSAIRSDASRAAVESGDLLPLLLALSMAPIPTESTQLLAAEVLAKVLVASSPKVVDGFVGSCRVVEAVEMALRGAVSSHVTTAILELYFVVASVSPAAAVQMLGEPSVVKGLVALLPAAVPAQACYVAAILQTLARIPDAAAVLCSYDVHHKVLSCLYDTTETEISVTAVSMLVRLVIVLLKAYPVPFRNLCDQPPLARLLLSLLTATWEDLAQLGCVLLSTFLSMASTPQAATQTKLRSLAQMLLQAPTATRGVAPPRNVAVAREPRIVDSSVAVVTLSTLCGASEAALAVSASYALLRLVAHCPQIGSEKVFRDGNALHGIVTCLMDDAGESERPRLMSRVIVALTLCTLVASGSPSGRAAFARNSSTFLSATTREAVYRRAQHLVLLADASLVALVRATLPWEQSTSWTRDADSSHNDGVDDLDSESVRDLLLHALHVGLQATPKSVPFAALPVDTSTAVAADKQMPNGPNIAPLTVLAYTPLDEPPEHMHKSAFMHRSISVVLRLAMHYAHSDSIVADHAKTTTTSHGATECDNTRLPTSRSASAATSCWSRTAESDRSGWISPATTRKLRANDWAPVERHDVDRKWTIENLKRSDVYLFDCLWSDITESIQRAMDGLVLHAARLRHELQLSSMSFPLRRCVLQDLECRVYPRMLSCLQFIAQELGSGRTAHQVILESARSVSSANVLEVYHAIGLAAGMPPAGTHSR